MTDQAVPPAADVPPVLVDILDVVTNRAPATGPAYDASEGTAAWMEKRTPKWRNR